MRVLALALGALLAGPAGAQTSPTPASPSAAQPPATAPAKAASARDACRTTGQARDLRGPKLRDHVTVCLLEARLECTKQAVAKESVPREQQAFVRTCLGM